LRPPLQLFSCLWSFKENNQLMVLSMLGRKLWEIQL